MDGGLGVKKLFFLNTLGVREDRVDRLCTAQCPQEKTEEFTYAADEGKHTFKAQVQDNVERNSVISEWPVNVDRVEPQMTTSGTLKDPRPWSTTGGSLRIEAKDEDPVAHRPQGGVTSIDVLVNDQRVDGATQAYEQGGCPLTHEFVFPDERYPDGTYQVKAVVTDQAGNKVEESHTVRLDRVGPQLTITGNLYDDYRPGARYSREALYDPEYLVDVEARDGSVTELQSGISKVELRVDGQARPTDTRAQPCALGSCPLTSSFKLFTDEYPDGHHTASVVATDHAGSTTEVSWPVIIDRRGDIYTAKEQAGPVPDFDPDVTIEREWGRIDTHDARMQDEDWITTRTTRNTDGDEPYDEVRRVSRLDDDEDPETGEPYPDQEEAWTEKRGSSPDDPDLPVVASILEPEKYFDGEEPEETGEIHAALAPGQQPPPAYGPTYEVHEREAKIEEEDGSRSEGTARFWIDGRTRMPIKQVVTREGGEHYVSAFWNYHHSRFERSEKSDDFFSIGKPDNTGMEKEEEDNGFDPLGNVLDEETDALFSPYYVGETVTLSTGPYVLADTKIVRQRLSAQT